MKNYDVRLKSEHKELRVSIPASSEEDAAKKFATSKGHYDTEIVVASGFLSDFKTYKFPKPVVTKIKQSSAFSVDLTLVDQVLIAKRAIQGFPFEKFNEIQDLLEGTVEVKKAISELNETIIENYRQLIIKKILENKGASFPVSEHTEDIKALTRQVMAKGIRAVLKHYSIGQPSQVGTPHGGQEIEEKGSWKDIQSRI